MKLLFLSCCLLSLSLSLQAQDIDLLGNYAKSDAREYCWTTNDYDPNETYPESWNDQSVICLRTEQRYFFYDEDYTNTVIGFIAHYRYKLLDEAAVEDFSEVYYKDVECNESYASCVNEVGIRIIKPDGKIVEVEDAEIISMDDNRNKVAIPTLEVGDVLDYYVFRYIDYPDQYLGKYSEFDRTLVRDEYPIKQFRYSVVTNANWKMVYSSGEYDLPFQQRILKAKAKWRTDSKWDKREERFYEYSIEKTDIEPVEATRWNYYYRTNPYLKLMVLFDNEYLYGVSDTSEVWYEEKAETKYIKEQYWSWLNKSGSYNPQYSRFSRYMKKKYGRDPIPNSIWVEEWFYYVRYFYTNKYYIQHRKSGDYGEGAESYRGLKNESFMRYMVYGLTKRKIKHDLIFLEDRNEGRLEDLVHVAELDMLMRIHVEDNKTHYVYRPNPYTHYNAFPYMAEGTQFYALKKDTRNPFANGYSYDFRLKEEAMGTSNYKDNLLKATTKATLDKEDPTVLQTQNEIIATGHQRYSYKYAVIDWMDMIQKEHAQYGEKSLLRALDNEQEYGAFRKDEAEKRDERLKEVMVEYFAADEDDIEVTGNSVTSSANLPGEDSLHFQIDCTVKGFVKKVGPNYILQLGKLTGDQLLLDEDDLERNTDIYMPYPRGYEYTIDVTIPEGYEVKGLDKFNNNIDNETGSLISSATLEGTTIRLRFRKYYKNNYEPKENWGKMVEFIQPGAEFLTKEVLLKKKRD